MLSSKHLAVLFDSLREGFDLSGVSEITLEANPATFDLRKAELFVELGVTRVSLGIQSFTPHVLETLGREHSPEQASASVGIVRAAGIPSVNIDLMFSIPGQSLADWRGTLQHTVSLNPDHISAYNLTYEEDTAFFDSLQNGTFRENEDHDADHYHLAEEILTAAGFDHYETSNYARPATIRNTIKATGRATTTSASAHPPSPPSVAYARKTSRTPPHTYVRRIPSATLSTKPRHSPKPSVASN